MRIVAVVALAVLVLALAGCSGGGTPTLHLNTDPVINPPVGTQATSPSATKFGPIAGYLPPSGTIISYKNAGLLNIDGSSTRLQFVSYDNTAGTMVLDVQSFGGEAGPSHSRFTFWIKKTNGQSYCYKRKKVFYDEVRTPETSTFTPGVLMGLFAAGPQINCSFTAGGHSTGSHSYTEKYLGTATIVGGSSTYANCVIAETSNFMPGDIAKIQLYWAPNKGPVMASLSPAILIKGAAPWWCRLGSVKAIGFSAK